MFQSNIWDRLNVKYPIVQGGMAWVANHSLASAVSNAGGLGIIAAANAPTEVVRREIQKTKEKTNRPFGVNVMLLSENAEEVAHMVCEEGVKVVTTGAGNPGKYMELWKSYGIIVIPVVPSVALGKRMERYGADALIVEGNEAGGHIGELTTMTLVPQVVDAVSIPVIAAGGIGDGRGMAAAFMLGAQGVQIGTRFLVAKECTIHPSYKEKILRAKDIDTVVTGRSTGHPVRILRNQLSRELIEMEKNQAPIEVFDEAGKGALRRAVVEGDVERGSIMAGQIAGLIRKEQTCQEIIQEMMEQMKQVIKDRCQI
ncbi:MAG: enoyl-[acyl-carrier-protein] reductase FabK [Epulopiscium sp.]|nr:enoyl-[acyl-carrier-protein] reductase FabK [Candidatus Epulonipiscium sp.]